MLQSIDRPLEKEKNYGGIGVSGEIGSRRRIDDILKGRGIVEANREAAIMRVREREGERRREEKKQTEKLGSAVERLDQIARNTRRRTAVFA